MGNSNFKELENKCDNLRTTLKDIKYNFEYKSMRNELIYSIKNQISSIRTDLKYLLDENDNFVVKSNLRKLFSAFADEDLSGLHLIQRDNYRLYAAVENGIDAMDEICEIASNLTENNSFSGKLKTFIKSVSDFFMKPFLALTYK